mgnify:CR=1 FL=1
MKAEREKQREKMLAMREDKNAPDEKNIDGGTIQTISGKTAA